MTFWEKLELLALVLHEWSGGTLLPVVAIVLILLLGCVHVALWQAYWARRLPLEVLADPDHNPDLDPLTPDEVRQILDAGGMDRLIAALREQERGEKP